MMRLAAAILVAILATFPLTVLPSAPVTWLAVPGLVAGGAGAITLTVPLVTLGASLTLIAYALALVIVRPAADPVAAIAFGVTLVLLPALVHLAARTHGAAIGPAVIAAQLRHWVFIAAVGVVVAVTLTAAAVALVPLVQGAPFTVVMVLAAFGALVAVAGVIALVTTRQPAADGPAQPGGPRPFTIAIRDRVTTYL